MRLKLLPALFIVFLAFVCLSACAPQAAAPSAAAAASASPPPSEAASPSPDAPASTAPSTAPEASQPQAGTDPVAIGELTPEMQAYIIGRADSYKDLKLADCSRLFSGSTSEDLDGDGAAENIELTPTDGETEEDNGELYYPGLKINIGGAEQTVVLDKPFCPTGKNIAPGKIDGYIVDVLAGDGKKEVLVLFHWVKAAADTPFSYARLFTYSKGSLTMIPIDCNIDFVDCAVNGTGYIAYEQFIKNGKFKTLDPETGRRGITVYGFKKFDETGSALADIPLSRLIPAYFEDLHTYWARPAYTEWKQELSAAPGAKPSKSLAKKSKIKIGLYDASGWLQILSVKGKELGWVDLTEVDLNAFTGDYYILEL